MRWFYLDYSYFWKITLLTFLFFKIFSGFIFFLWFIIIVLFLYFIRKPQIVSKDLNKNEAVFVSPVTGTVVEIENNYSHQLYSIEKSNLIKIFISPLEPIGLHLPASVKVNLVDEKMSEFKWKIFKFKKANKILVFENGFNEISIIKIYPKLILNFSNFWVKSGDLGTIRSCFGLLPFGGVLEISIPQKDDIIVNIGDKVLAAQTILAARRESL